MIKFTSLTVAVLLLFASLLAVAQPHRGILSLDSDGDGRVSREEFQPPEQRRGPNLFARADSDADGAITRDEMQLAVEEGVEERQERMREHAYGKFDEMDADGNGVVTEVEAQDHAFARIDADGDGFVTEQEVEAMREMRRGKRHRDGGPRS